jgi:hypothetical protein
VHIICSRRISSLQQTNRDVSCHDFGATFNAIVTICNRDILIPCDHLGGLCPLLLYRKNRMQPPAVVRAPSGATRCVGSKGYDLARRIRTIRERIDYALDNNPHDCTHERFGHRRLRLSLPWPCRRSFAGLCTHEVTQPDRSREVVISETLRFIAMPQCNPASTSLSS